MNNRALLLAILAVGALVSISVVTSSAIATPSDYLGLKWGKVKNIDFLASNSTNSQLPDEFINFVAKAKGNIPQDGTSAFGYAFLMDGANEVVVIVTHNGIVDTTYDLPQHGFHGHTLKLKEAESSFCTSENATLEVDIESSVAMKGFGEEYDVRIVDKKAKLRHMDSGLVTDHDVDNVVAFTASGQTVSDTDLSPTAICVFPTDSI